MAKNKIDLFTIVSTFGILVGFAIFFSNVGPVTLWLPLLAGYPQHGVSLSDPSVIVSALILFVGLSQIFYMVMHWLLIGGDS